MVNLHQMDDVNCDEIQSVTDETPQNQVEYLLLQKEGSIQAKQNMITQKKRIVES